jgi:inorganic pyrophosphatase
LATHIRPARETSQIEPTLKNQLLVSTVLMTLGLLGSAFLFLPTTHNIFQSSEGRGYEEVANWHIFLCTASGLWAGLAIGYITEYYTSNRFVPVQDVSKSCETGAATNIISGLALGYKSVIIPCIALAFSSFLSHELAGFYGVAMAALGILSTLSIGLTIDAFGPISDNAGGIAEMCNLGEETRRRTDALDAAGNTTAAIGKGYAIGSAAFVSLALFSGYVTIVQSRSKRALAAVDVLQAFPFAGLLVGAMIPYWFSAMTMRSVGDAANEMVLEVRKQFATRTGIMAGTEQPDYDTCIRISTDASLKEMIPPGALVMLTPLIVGFIFGVQMLAGVLLGALVSGVQMAQSASNTGGAWDNAKKYIEQGNLPNGHGKGSEEHKAAVVGDTVGDPLKDTSGPSLNIVMKLMAIISLVFARAFPTNQGALIGFIWNS